jgi:cysteine desulfurase
MYASKGNHIITCAIEHKAVLDSCKHLEKLGIDVSYLPVLSNGSIDLKDLEAAIRPGTILISIMYANNEIGTIMPVKAISELAGKHGILFFTDATQAVGKIPVDVNKDQIDLLALTAHKMYGPKGVGALYVRRRDPRVRLACQMDGGGHERGMRSGTLNVPGIVGLGKAAELAQLEMLEESNRLRKMRDLLEHELLLLDQTFVNGYIENRLPHMTNISFQHVEGEALLMGINKEIAISSGSACTSASIEPSYVLKALGLNDELAHSSLRFGLGRNTTEEEIAYTIEKVSGVVNNLREMSPLWENRNSR